MYRQIASACPIISASIGTIGDSTTVKFQPTPAATTAQKAAAQNLIDTFDWSDTAQQAWEDGLEPSFTDLKTTANTALAAIDAYLTIPAPTAAQIGAEVKAIDQRQKKIIQVLLRVLSKL